MTGPASILWPTDLRLNAYKSMPGGQDVFSLLIHAFVHVSIGILESA